MTVFSKPSNGKNITVAMQCKIIPPIPYEHLEAIDLVKDEYQMYKLCSQPKSDKSPVYNICVPYFRNGTCKEYLKFIKNLEQVIYGQNITTTQGKFVVARRLLEGEALTTFNAAIGTSETDAAYKQGLQAVHDTVFTARAVLTQKRYMWCFLRKPARTKMAEFVTRLHKINAYLPKFPGIGTMEPVALPDDELLDILEYGIPNTWHCTMILCNFDPLEHSVAEFVLFCKWMEQVKNQEGTLSGPKSILKHLPDRLDAKANAMRKKQ